MKDGYNLVNFTKVKRDEKNKQVVVAVAYEVVAHLEDGYTEEDVFTICTEKRLEFGDIMIVKVSDDKVIECCNMIFSNEDEETGEIEWWTDCCEWDFRVYASVAFNNDKLVC